MRKCECFVVVENIEGIVKVHKVVPCIHFPEVTFIILTDAICKPGWCDNMCSPCTHEWWKWSVYNQWLGVFTPFPWREGQQILSECWYLYTKRLFTTADHHVDDLFITTFNNSLRKVLGFHGGYSTDMIPCSLGDGYYVLRGMCSFHIRADLKMEAGYLLNC